MNPSLIWISASLFVWGIGEGMFLIFQPFYLAQLGANPVTIGYILGASGLAMTIAHIPAGYLSDTVGRKPMLLAAWILGVIATATMALATTLPVFSLGLIIYGFTAFVSSPLNSYVIASAGNWSVGRAITFATSAFTLGVVLGPLTGGVISENFGLRSVYTVAAVLFILSTIFLLQIRAQARDPHNVEDSHFNLLWNKPYLSFLGVGLFAILAMYLPQPFTARFLQDVHGLTLQQIGLLGTIGGIGNTLLTFFLGAIEARLGFILGQLAVLLYSTIIWKLTGFPWYALSYFLLGGYRVARSLFMAQIRPLVKQSQIGLAFGISEAVLGLGIIISPILAGVLYDLSPAGIYPLSIAAIIISIVLSIFTSPQISSREAMPAPIEIIE